MNKELLDYCWNNPVSESAIPDIAIMFGATNQEVARTCSMIAEEIARLSFDDAAVDAKMDAYYSKQEHNSEVLTSMKREMN